MQVLSLFADGFQVLLPVSMVAQIIGRTQVIEAEPVVRGMAGKISWREFEVPLLLTSELMAAKTGKDESYERIVVLWPMKSAGNQGFLSLTSLGPPRVIDIEDQTSPAITPDLNYLMGAVVLDNGVGAIPDIDLISSDIYRTPVTDS
jgi:hypothetical protein